MTSPGRSKRKIHPEEEDSSRTKEANETKGEREKLFLLQREAQSERKWISSASKCGGELSPSRNRRGAHSIQRSPRIDGCQSSPLAFRIPPRIPSDKVRRIGSPTSDRGRSIFCVRRILPIGSRHPAARTLSSALIAFHLRLLSVLTFGELTPSYSSPSIPPP